MDSALLPGLQLGSQKVSVCIPNEQQSLEEKHAGSPDRRRSTEPRQEILGDYELHGKEKERSKENR